MFAEFGQGVAIEQVVESSRDGDVVTCRPTRRCWSRRICRCATRRRPNGGRRSKRRVWALGQLRQVGPLQVRTLREADWANAWKEYFFVHRVGRRTVIVPSWREAEYEPRP